MSWVFWVFFGIGVWFTGSMAFCFLFIFLRWLLGRPAVTVTKEHKVYTWPAPKAPEERN